MNPIQTIGVCCQVLKFGFEAGAYLKWLLAYVHKMRVIAMQITKSIPDHWPNFLPAGADLLLQGWSKPDLAIHICP